MGKLAVLKNVSFDLRKTFAEIDKLPEYLKDKIEYIDFTNTLDMHRIIGQVIGNRKTIEIVNCGFDDTYLTQAFTEECDDPTKECHDNILVIKRKINDNDTYTYSEFSFDNPVDSDRYVFAEITFQDIIDIVARKSMSNGVYVRAGDMNYSNVTNTSILFCADTDDVGRIQIRDNNKNTNTTNMSKEIVYLNLANIVNSQHDDSRENNQEEISRMIQEKANAYCSEYIFTQISKGFVILNCYYQTFGKTKNEIMSSMLGTDIYGDAILLLQSCTNEDTETRFNIDVECFKKLHKLLTCGRQKIVPKNTHFFNIYHELANMVIAAT